jgi:excisionase family DNA binding protein
VQKQEAKNLRLTIEPLVTAAVMGKALNCSPKTIKRMAARGEIAGLRIGNRWRFRLSSSRQLVTKSLTLSAPSVSEKGCQMKRTRYQFGSVELKPRKKGPAIWVFRWKENGRRRSTLIGTVSELQTRAEALKKAEALRMQANPDHRPRLAVTFGGVIDRYIREELPVLRHSTQGPYLTIIERHIRPRWGEVPLEPFNGLAVQEWFRNMQAAPKYKGHIRAAMHRLYEKAMLWGFGED